MKITVYTAETGYYDDVHGYVAQEVPETWDVDWVYLVGEAWIEPPREFGSRRDPRDVRFMEAVNLGWDPKAIVRDEKVASEWPDRLISRWAKCHPHVLFPGSDVTIWIDACLEIRSPDFVYQAASQILHVSPLAGVASVAMFPHPDRATVREEIGAADTLRKYDGNRHAEMVETFEKVLGGRDPAPPHGHGRDRPGERPPDPRPRPSGLGGDPGVDRRTVRLRGPGPVGPPVRLRPPGG